MMLLAKMAAMLKVATALTPPISYTANGGVAGSGTSASQSFASVPFGTADATRLVVVFIFWTTGSTVRTISSVTIGGVSAAINRKVPNSGNAGACIAIAYAAVPTGTSGTVAVTFSGTLATTPQCYAYSIYNPTSNTALGDDNANSGTNQSSDTVHPAASSAPRLVGLVGACFNNTGVTSTWSDALTGFPIAEDADTSPVSSLSYSVASGVMNNGPAGSLGLQDTFSFSQTAWKYAMEAVTFA